MLVREGIKMKSFGTINCKSCELALTLLKTLEAPDHDRVKEMGIDRTRQ
jgi:hypothetical protein